MTNLTTDAAHIPSTSPTLSGTRVPTLYLGSSQSTITRLLQGLWWLSFVGILLTGCQTTGQLTPQVQAQITAAYNAICPGVSSGALDQLMASQNQNVQTSYAAAKQICAAGAPTNLVVAGMDILTLQVVLAPYISRVHISTKGVIVK